MYPFYFNKIENPIVAKRDDMLVAEINYEPYLIKDTGINIFTSEVGKSIIPNLFVLNRPTKGTLKNISINDNGRVMYSKNITFDDVS